MTLAIVLTPRAKETFNAITLQIRDRWGDDPANNFVEKVYETLDTIAQQPYLFKAYNEENVRKAVITKQTSLIYRIAPGRIEVLFLWDNRQEPIF